MLAVLWSFLLLGERIDGRQGVGIVVAVAGLLGFTVLNLRGGRSGPTRR